MISVLLGNGDAVSAQIHRSRFNARPTDFGPAILDMLMALSRSQALLLDEVLEMQGKARQVSFRPPKGSGQDGPVLVKA